VSDYYKQVSTPVDIEVLKNLYNSLEKQKVKRYYNLHYLYKADIPRDNWMQEFNRDGFSIYSQYFLEYPVNSFTRLHTDNNDEIFKTAITLVDVEDLEGGDIIIYEPHYKLDWDVTPDVLNRYRDGDYTPGDPIIPVIVKQEVGETIEYEHNVFHSVSKVTKGKRLVLVTWYTKQKKVLLVGNGTSILDKELGEEIDSFDEVVRFNSFTTKGYEKYTGSKTNVWFTCMDKHIEDINEFDNVICHSWFNENECDLFKKLTDRRKVVHKIEDFNYYGLKAPSTGLIAIDYYLKQNYEVWLHGFDWWDRTEHHYADDEKRGDNHKPLEELKIIKGFGDRVKFLSE
tara:strand:- start:29533 stop:30558 length:1026 start_codon:yes stop_codon:yes gene_type:complete